VIDDPEGAKRACEKALAESHLDATQAKDLTDLASNAVDLARARGGRLKWIEQLVSSDRVPGLRVWGRLDVLVDAGQVAPLEVIDWTFGRRRYMSAEDLATSSGTILYTLIAGGCTPRSRPIAVTDVHVPSLTQTTAVLTPDEVLDGVERIQARADEIRQAIATNAFPPNPGPHCDWCDFQSICPVAGSVRVAITKKGPVADDW
jgi:hypothetical protein